LTQPVGPVRCFRAFESAPPLSLTGPAAPAPLTAVRSPDKEVSQPLLLDHAELAAAEEAQREAARARRGGRPICRRGRARTSEPVASSVLSLHPGRSPVLHSSRKCDLQARDGPGLCCPIMRSRQQRTRHSVMQRGRGAAGGPSAGAVKPARSRPTRGP
jgi:hypothetical protein